MATPPPWVAQEPWGSTSEISRCRAASTSASAWDSDHETHTRCVLDQRPGLHGRLQRLPRRQHQPERPAIGLGEPLPAADAALAGDVAAIRWRRRGPLRAGVVLAGCELQRRPKPGDAGPW